MVKNNITNKNIVVFDVEIDIKGTGEFSCGFMHLTSGYYKYTIGKEETYNEFKYITEKLKATLAGFNNIGYDNEVINRVVFGDETPVDVNNSIIGRSMFEGVKTYNLTTNGPSGASMKLPTIDIMTLLTPSKNGSLKVLGLTEQGRVYKENMSTNMQKYNKIDLEITKQLLLDNYHLLETEKELAVLFDSETVSSNFIVSTYLRSDVFVVNEGGYNPVSDIKQFKGIIDDDLIDIFIQRLDIKNKDVENLITKDGYQVGKGGFHYPVNRQGKFSFNKNVTNADYASYYPSLYLKYLSFFTPEAKEVLNKLLTKRLKAKKAGDLKYSNTIKLFINTMYGQLKAINPKYNITVAVLGQLGLIQLIRNILKDNPKNTLIEANTDGVYFTQKIPNINTLNPFKLIELEVDELLDYTMTNSNCKRYVTEKGNTVSKGAFYSNVKILNCLNCLGDKFNSTIYNTFIVKTKEKGELPVHSYYKITNFKNLELTKGGFITNGGSFTSLLDNHCKEIFEKDTTDISKFIQGLYKSYEDKHLGEIVSGRIEFKSKQLEAFYQKYHTQLYLTPRNGKLAYKGIGTSILNDNYRLHNILSLSLRKDDSITTTKTLGIIPSTTHVVIDVDDVEVFEKKHSKLHKLLLQSPTLKVTTNPKGTYKCIYKLPVGKGIYTYKRFSPELDGFEILSNNKVAGIIGLSVNKNKYEPDDTNITELSGEITSYITSGLSKKTNSNSYNFNLNNKATSLVQQVYEYMGLKLDIKVDEEHKVLCTFKCPECTANNKPDKDRNDKASLTLHPNKVGEVPRITVSCFSTSCDLNLDTNSTNKQLKELIVKNISGFKPNTISTNSEDNIFTGLWLEPKDYFKFNKPFDLVEFAHRLKEKYHMKLWNETLYMYSSHQKSYKIAQKGTIKSSLLLEFKITSTTFAKQLEDTIALVLEMYKVNRVIPVIDTAPTVVNFKNGIYLVDTGEFVNHSPNIFTLHQIDRTYIQDVEIADIQNNPMVKVIYEITAKSTDSDKHLSKILFNIIGFSGVQNQKHTINFMLYGTGANGKSVFSNLIPKLLGDELVCRVSPSDMGKPFGLQSMNGKLVNVVGEIEADEFLNNTSTFKKITDKTATSVSQKFMENVNMVFLGTTICSNNFLPKLSQMKAMQRRLVIIPFLKTFGTKSTVDDKNILNFTYTTDDKDAFYSACFNDYLVNKNDDKALFQNTDILKLYTEVAKDNNPVLEFLQDEELELYKLKIANDIIIHREDSTPCNLATLFDSYKHFMTLTEGKNKGDNIKRKDFRYNLLLAGYSNKMIKRNGQSYRCIKKVEDDKEMKND